MMNSDYDDLAERAERGELKPIPGTIRRGPEAVADARRLLMEAEAGYVALPRLVTVEALPDGYQLAVRVEGETSIRIVDVSRYLRGPMGEPVKERAVFEAVSLDHGGAVTWPNGYDIDTLVLPGERESASEYDEGNI